MTTRKAYDRELKYACVLFALVIAILSTGLYLGDQHRANVDAREHTAELARLADTFEARVQEELDKRDMFLHRMSRLHESGYQFYEVRTFVWPPSHFNNMLEELSEEEEILDGQ